MHVLQGIHLFLLSVKIVGVFICNRGKQWYNNLEYPFPLLHEQEMCIYTLNKWSEDFLFSKVTVTSFSISLRSSRRSNQVFFFLLCNDFQKYLRMYNKHLEFLPFSQHFTHELRHTTLNDCFNYMTVGP